MLMAWLAAFVPVAHAQSDCGIRLSVQLVEAHNYEPVYPAQVYVTELKQSFDADEKGKVTISNLCPGTYTFHLQAAGYEESTETASVTAATGNLRFKIGHLAQTLGQVEVKEERNRTLVQSKAQLSKADLSAGSGKNLADLLQGVNGVSTFSNGATIAKPVIHGLYGNRIVLLNNGIRQEDQQWGGEHAPNIDPFLANSITVIKGAAGVRYGTDALGGVVLVEPAPLNYQPGNWSGELNLAAFSNNRMGVASGMLEHSFAKLPGLSVRVQGTWKKGGNYQLPSGRWVANTGLEETNYSATLGWRRAHYGAEVFYSHFNTDLGIYRGSHTGNEKDLLNAINSPEPLVPASFSYAIGRPKQHVEHDLLKTKLYADNRFGLWSLTYAYQHNFRQEYDVLRTENGRAQLNLTLNTQTLNLNLDHRAFGPITGSVGVDGMYQDNFFRDGDRLFIPNYSSMGGAAYWIERYRHKNWTLEGGLRYDYKWYDVFNPEGQSQVVKEYTFDYSSVSGTLGFRQQLKPSWEWSATLANAWRAPQSNELFSAGLHHGAARIELGNKDLQPERSYNLNLETKYTPGRLSIDLSLYNQWIDNYIYLEPGADMLTIRGYFKTFSYKQTDALLSGADLTLGYRWDQRLSTTFKAAFLRAWDRNANDWLILMPADRLSLGTRYTHPLGGRVRDGFIGATGRYVFRQQRIPSDFDAIDYPRPPAACFVLDAEAGATLQLGRQPVYASLAVSNALNARYRDYLDAFRYFLDQPGTNVALRLRVPFHFNKNKTNDTNIGYEL